MSLLDKAMKAKTTNNGRKIFSEEEKDLAKAYLKGIVTLSQVTSALGFKVKNTSRVYCFISCCCKFMARNGDIKI